MIILSHRGYWKVPAEKNTEAAFRRSFALGFGTETDLRDRCGELVISHDPPTGGEITVRQFLSIYREYDTALPLALNVKADGLQPAILSLLKEFNIGPYFLFDMSIPDHRGYLQYGLRTFTRQSEFEPTPSFYEQSDGVWLDEFEGHWLDETTIQRHQQSGKRLCIVSPDLHGRPYAAEWELYRQIEPRRRAELMLCTDAPEVARAFFSGGDQQ